MFYRDSFYVFRGSRVIKTTNKNTDVVLDGAFFCRKVDKKEVDLFPPRIGSDAIFYRRVFYLLKNLKSLVFSNPNIIGLFYIDKDGEFLLLQMIECDHSSIRDIPLNENGMPSDALHIGDVLNLITYVKNNTFTPPEKDGII